MDGRIVVGYVFNIINYSGATRIATILCPYSATNWDLPDPILATNLGGLPTHVVLLIIIFHVKIPYNGDWDPQSTGGEDESFIEAEVLASLEESSLDFLDGGNLLLKAEIIIPLLRLIKLFLFIFLQVDTLLLQLLDLGPQTGDLCLGVLKMVVEPSDHPIRNVELLFLAFELTHQQALLVL